MGAPEFILDASKDSVSVVCDEMATQGYRVLAFASSKHPFKGQKLPGQLKLEGYIFITDKVREEAPDTLRFFREQGVTLKIISGDNPVTVRAVALRAGLENCDDIIDMSTVGPDANLVEIAEKHTIFGRVLPDQKLALVKALKANKHTVAMTGDGVNDVLALKESDCSIAMASGSDAAKNVSSLVLLDSNFASLPKVVAEGRRSINNLERSASLFLVKTLYNFLLALIFLCIDTGLPFEPKQLTLMSMVTIGIPSFILALEPNTERVTGRFLPKVLSSALPGAIMVVAAVGCVLVTKTFFVPELSEEQLRTMYLLVTVFVGFLYLFKVCLPFNIVHAVLYAGCLAIFILCHFIKLPFLNFQDLFGLSTEITPNMGKALGIIGVIILPWSIIFLRATNKFHDWLERFLDKRLNDKRSLVNIIERKLNEKEDDRKPHGLVEKIMAKIEELTASKKANKEKKCKKSTNS